jgi:glycosyltransferase involved in cell wall biosynthesis
MTLLDAMTSGVAVVASLSCGIREFLQNEINCLTFEPPGYPGQIATLLERFFDEKALSRVNGGSGSVVDARALRSGPDCQGDSILSRRFNDEAFGRG